MSKTVIKVESLSKLYRLGEVGTGTISHDLNRWWAKVRGKEDPYAIVGQKNDRTQKATSDYVWALKDINFEVKQGDVVGIIGRNGAGKSTLLKLLSRVTSPTEGNIKYKGRIASLLEVGTGMHPELTGRENIFLNGTIMGMSKAEIQRKFDEIVDFAGCALFVDTPVKRYSSGMKVRLGFAVAAFLEPEILIVDEVLAVGDAEFQKKAIGKMQDVSSTEGRTVLFVSHNMGSIQQLCKRALCMRNGVLAYDGETSDVIQKYLKSGAVNSEEYVGDELACADKPVWFKNIFLTNSKGEKGNEFMHDESILINYKIGFNLDRHKHDYSIFCMVLDNTKARVFAAESKVVNSSRLKLKINKSFLVRGSYSIHTFIHKPRTQQVAVAEDICSFTVIDNGSFLNIHGEYDYGKVFGSTEWIYEEVKA